LTVPLERPQPITFDAGKGYDSIYFVMELHNEAVTPHVAQERPPLVGQPPHHPPSRLRGLPAMSANASRRPSVGAKEVPG
jgi:hypothetical protein